jgi:phosphoesterase RecJ-like protein
VNISPLEAAGALQDASRILIAAHSDPDGDALGSVLGLHYLLTGQGKQTWLYRNGALPVDFDFLPGAELVSSGLPPADWPDLLVLVDCCQLERSGQTMSAWLPAGLRVLVLDHHLGESDPRYMVSKSSAYSATAELMAAVAQAAGWQVSEAAAMSLYAALIADTGNFTQGNTTAAALRTAAWLVDKGARPDVLNMQSRRMRAARLRLHGLGLNRVEAFACGRICISSIGEQDLRAYDCGIADLSGLVGMMAHIEGVLIVALFAQTEDGCIKVSVRSRRHINVAALAAAFGGGGHKNAAGYKVCADMQLAKSQFVQKAAVLLEETLEA